MTVSTIGSADIRTHGPGRPSNVQSAALFALALALCAAHSLAVWIACGGWTELSSPWPLAKHDHPLHFHSSTLAPRFFARSATNAGYDPYFMAGYPKSVVFPESAAMYDAAAIVTGGVTPPQTHKFTVFFATVAPVWLVVLACWLWRLTSGATAGTALLFLLYTWTDGGGAGYPLNYAYFGMASYLVVVPLGLATLAAFTRYLDQGGLRRWLLTAILGTLTLLAHATSLMVVAPAAFGAFFFKSKHAPATRRPLGVVVLIATAIGLNAWWWWPGLFLTGMRGASSVAFVHEEGPWARLWQVATNEPNAQMTLIALGLPGFWVLGRIGPRARLALALYAGCGFAWGYLAGSLPPLAFLQPGRHTYVLYICLCVAGGASLAAACRALRGFSWWVQGLVVVLAALLTFRVFHAELDISLGVRVFRSRFLSSRPSPRLQWLVDQFRTHLKPGDRVLYEESGNDLEGVPDPYQGGRFSGLLPYLTGVEMLGGPYLHAGVKTNFTQFGEGRLFGRADWDEAHFQKYAEVYRPDAVVFWSPAAFAFFDKHPELIEPLAADSRMLPVADARTGKPVGVLSRLIFGRIRGHGGCAIRGEASVRASAGRIEVDRAKSAELDGRVVLSYHNVPRLRSRPRVVLEDVRMGDDPVPFIAFRPPGFPFVLETDFRP